LQRSADFLAVFEGKENGKGEEETEEKRVGKKVREGREHPHLK